MHQFHQKYAHLFCGEDVGEDGTLIYLYRKETRTWTSFELLQQIRAYVSTIATDYARELIDIQVAMQAAQGDDRDALQRRQAGVIKLIQRCGKGNTIGTIASLLYAHLLTLHSTKRIQMNPDPLALNCANGLVDLNTGKLRWQRPEDYLTRCTHTPYDPEVDYSWWEKAVRDICDRDDELYEFLHTWIGYSATGLRRDHALVVMFGTGRNGKSLLIDAVAAALGGYATKLPRGYLESSGRAGSDNNELFATADLHAARFAYGSEASEGSEFKSEMIKSLTGDETIKARHSRENFKTFKVSHKITLATNYKPRVNADDQAMFARLKLFPCHVRFGPKEDVEIGEAKYEWDQTLLERCKSPAGRAAVLRWIVDGARKYLQQGSLKTPQIIKHQIALHRKAMDTFDAFLTECTEYIEKIETDKLEAISGRGGKPEQREQWKALGEKDYGLARCEIEKSTFYQMYRSWCRSMGIDRPRTQLAFNEYLKDKVRVWVDDLGEEVKMPPMHDRKVQAVWKWRWVRLSPRGRTFFTQVVGREEWEANHGG